LPDADPNAPPFDDIAPADGGDEPVSDTDPKPSDD